MFDYTKEEHKLLKRLSTPIKIQDYLNTLKNNKRDTCWSPRHVMIKKKAHCMEGAMLAAAALWYHDKPPLVVDLKSVAHDLDHVITVYHYKGRWGAISKTNHAVLRYRDPLYRDIRELVMSYFNEYFLDDGSKTLLSYSAPVNLGRFKKRSWPVSERPVWYIPEFLDTVPHYKILSKTAKVKLRSADLIEIKAGKLTEWPK